METKMTDNAQSLVERLRRTATCIHIAVEKAVADDVDKTCREAADLITRLLAHANAETARAKEEAASMMRTIARAEDNYERAEAARERAEAALREIRLMLGRETSDHEIIILIDAALTPTPKETT